METLTILILLTNVERVVVLLIVFEVYHITDLLSCYMTIWRDNSISIYMLFAMQVVKPEDDDFQEFQDASKSGSLDESFTDFQGDGAGSSKATSSQHRSR